jgi:hypothetical protein
MIALGVYGVAKAQHTHTLHKLQEWEDEHGSTGAEDGTLRNGDSMQAMDWGPVSTPSSIDSGGSHRHERLRQVESPPAQVELARRSASGGKKDKEEKPAKLERPSTVPGQAPGAVAVVVVEGRGAGKEDDERSDVTLRRAGEAQAGASDASVASQDSAGSGPQWLCKGGRCGLFHPTTHYAESWDGMGRRGCAFDCRCVLMLLACVLYVCCV